MKEDFIQVYRLLTPQERRRGIWVMVLMLLAAVLQVAAVGSIFPVLDAVTTVQESASGIHNSLILGTLWDLGGFTSTDSFLIVLSLGAMGLIIASNAAIAASEWAQDRFRYTATHTLSVRLMRRYLAQDYAYFLNRNTSELRKNILGEASQIANSLVQPSLKFVSNALLLVGLVVLVFILDPLTAALVFGTVGGGYAISYLFLKRRLERIGSEYVHANRRRFKVTNETFDTIKDVKLGGREHYFLGRFEPQSKRYTDRQAHRRLYKIVPKYLLEALAFGGLMAALAMFVVTGRSISQIIPIMGLFAFAGYRLMPAFEKMLDSASSFRFVDELTDIIEADLYELGQMADLPPVSEKKPARSIPFRREIRFENVTYVYPGEREAAIESLDLVIPHHASVGIVGPTGAGKTTVIDLLLGLLTPTEGRLVVDGAEIKPENVHRWQSNIGYVPQDIALIDDTVTRNIAFGVAEEEIDEEALRRVAEVAQIHEFIEENLPNGYETEVGERGVRLSGGQRQRIGIARALYHDPPILILDEATSDIDGETEASIAEGIREMTGNKTVVMVAHRLGTIRACDHVFLIEGGSISAKGTYETLLEESNRFQAMVHGPEA